MRAAGVALIAGLGLGTAPVLAQSGDPPPQAALGCLGCHGPRGTGAAPIPAIAGAPADVLAVALTDFAANRREGTIMGRIARGYTPAEVTALAAWFAAQRPGEPE
jgi:sulfide dehydrogenase cytochrome subunit